MRSNLLVDIAHLCVGFDRNYGLAQTPTGIISGTVTDESGAVIANAAISITNKATGTVRTVTANAAGIFSAP